MNQSRFLNIAAQYPNILVCYRNKFLLKIFPSLPPKKTTIRFHRSAMVNALVRIKSYDREHDRI